ncbi:MAG TPA: metallophosphoesterase family protein, partial [Candidatus Paceibacterota bacterium]|nr:metallophosphoesterase family protein [Candidatus Paceibacterota bacterium]
CNDIHCPFHDIKAVDMLIDFIRREKPDRIILAGDIIDFYAISRFNKDPKRRGGLRKEIYATRELLYCIRKAAPQAEIDYTKGNHEDRLRRYLWSDASELEGLDGLTVQDQLCVDKFDINYHEDGVEEGKLFVYHGSVVHKHAGYSARAEFEKNGRSGMSGHTHRDGKYTQRTRGGHFVWFENFCLCDLDAEYIDGVANWSQGWSVITSINGRQYVEQIPVINHRYIYKGKEWRA